MTYAHNDINCGLINKTYSGIEQYCATFGPFWLPVWFYNHDEISVLGSLSLHSLYTYYVGTMLKKNSSGEYQYFVPSLQNSQYPTDMNGINLCHTNLTNDEYYLELVYDSQWCLNPTSANNSGKWICKRCNHLEVYFFITLD